MIESRIPNNLFGIWDFYILKNNRYAGNIASKGRDAPDT